MGMKLGLPPLTRELLEEASYDGNEVRITPAYAGTTPYYKYLEKTYGDYPRLRGNYQLRQCASFLNLGLPPLTRELLLISCCGIRQRRITPAYAGTTPTLNHSKPDT